MKLSQNKEEFKALAAYIAVCILWGSTYLAMRIGVSDFPPMIFGSIRFITAGSLMLMFAKLKGYKFPDKKADIFKISLVGFVMLSLCNGLVLWAEQWVYSSTASLILATNSLFIALIELALCKKNSLNFRGWLGLFIGFGGVALLIYSTSETGGINILGAAILLIASFFWSAGSLYSSMIKPSGSMLSHIGIQMAAGGLGQGVVGILLGQAHDVTFTSGTVGALLYLIFFGSIIGYSSFFYLLTKWPPVKAGTYAYVNPLVAVILGSLILNESISVGVVLSTIVILGGVMLVQFSKMPQKERVKETTAAQEA